MANNEKAKGSTVYCRLNEAHPIGQWIQYKDGSGSVYFSFCPKNRDNTNCVLTGSVKIEQNTSMDYSQDWDICEVIKYTEDLSTTMEFKSPHLGKTGIVMDLAKGTCFRLVLSPKAGDDLTIAVNISSC